MLSIRAILQAINKKQNKERLQITCQINDFIRIVQNKDMKLLTKLLRHLM
jgi:hypothetical protein